MSQPQPPVPDDQFFRTLLRSLERRGCVLGSQLLEHLVQETLPPAEAARMRAHLETCLSCLNTFTQLQALHETSQPRPRLVLDSPSAVKLQQELARLARMDDGPILIVGETGTGKGVVAREIHALSRRASRAFVEVDCKSRPASRLERGLFGYEYGMPGVDAAATPSLFEAADGGTLFLDDIELLPIDLQDKLFAALERRSPGRRDAVGAETRLLDVRVIAAAHGDLTGAVRRGAFRGNLLDRFSCRLTLLPLRQRPDDILPLARYFVDRVAVRQGATRRLTRDAEEQLRRYDWPGNVTELSTVIERAVSRRGREEISAEELGLRIR